MFASRPGGWVCSGQNNKIDAIFWVENNRYNSNLFKKKKNYTFKQFADRFFSEDIHGWRKDRIKKIKSFLMLYEDSETHKKSIIVTRDKIDQHAVDCIRKYYGFLADEYCEYDESKKLNIFNFE